MNSNKKNKKAKGISPIIATSILIALVVTLSVIVWIFLSGFIGELITKQEQPAETVCIDKVKISADVSLSSGSSDITVINEGAISLAGFQIELRKPGEAKRIYFPCSLNIGESTFDKTCLSDLSKFDGLESSCSSVKIIPSILGIGQRSGNKKLFNCENAAVESAC